MFTPSNSQRDRHGFTLTEVVMALGILVFAGVSLLGLFLVGMSSGKESIDELDATHVSQSILSVRKASPLATVAENFPLPPLDQPAEASTANPRFLDDEGLLVDNPARARFGMLYRVEPSATSLGSTRVYLCLYWPATNPPTRAAGRYETCSVLPVR